MPPATESIAVPETGRDSGELVWFGAERRWFDVDLTGLWRHRDLLLLLIQRDVKLRYRQTVFGILWAVLQPLGPMLVFAGIYRAFVKTPDEGAPYAVYVFAGLLLWAYFANSVQAAANSFVANGQLIKKVYFPRLVLPLASVASGLVDLAIAFVVLVVMMGVYGIAPTWRILFVPIVVGATALFAVAIGTLVASLAVVYRDLRHALPFLIQMWMFLTPIFYSTAQVPEQFRWIYAVNPLAVLIESLRAVLFGAPLNWPHLLVTTTAGLLILVWAAIAFGRCEAFLADEL